MGDIPIKVCPNENCYMFMPSATRVCAHCGYEFYAVKKKAASADWTQAKLTELKNKHRLRLATLRAEQSYEYSMAARGVKLEVVYTDGFCFRFDANGKATAQ